MEALKRIKANTIEKRLLNNQGNPNFGINFYIVNKKGEFAGVSMYASTRGRAGKYAVCTENGPETRDIEGLLGDAPTE
jgi:N4-(beta-N-acetylglucosaminyl)-L-asparaginase